MHLRGVGAFGLGWANIIGAFRGYVLKFQGGDADLEGKLMLYFRYTFYMAR